MPHAAPDYGLEALKLILVLFLVGLNGFFVAAEFAIVKVRATRLQGLADAGGRRAKLAMNIVAHLDSYLSATQLGITIASILLGAIGEETMRVLLVGPVLAWFHVTTPWIVSAVGFVLGTGIIVMLHVVLGELAPKSIAIQKPDATTMWAAYPLHAFYIVLWPAIAALNGAANFMLRLVGVQPATEHDVAHSEEELRLILAQSARQGTMPVSKLDLVDNVFDFGEILVRQIMVPRTEVAVFDLRRPLAENLATAEKTAHSRYPLIDGDLDQTLGVIHMKDLFWQLKELESGPDAASEAAARRNPRIAGGDLAAYPPSSGAGFLTAIVREMMFVPETMRIDTLLKDFQLRRIHMAVVVDEYGGTSGLVTFENVIEELVGEVQDEFDEEAPKVRATAEREFTLDGAATLDEVNEVLGTDLESDEADTIGGYVLSHLGRIPKPGDRLTTPGGELELQVREMRRQRIHRLVATLPDPAPAPTPTPGAPDAGEAAEES